MSWYKRAMSGSYEEFTVNVDYWNEKAYDGCFMEVMVHVDPEFEPFFAYTWADDAKTLAPEYVSRRKSKNPLFVYLTPLFIRDHYEQITERVSDRLSEEGRPVPESLRSQKDVGKTDQPVEGAPRPDDL
jgi:hypothetical protein